MRNTLRRDEPKVTVMHNYRMLFITLLVMLMTSLGLAAWSQDMLSYSNSELDEILAPIALYPDPLIAQILPAATYPNQLADADDFIGQYGSSSDIDIQNWDVSVKAVAYYPSVLHMMVDKPDWTVSVGQAYVDEPDHVMASIQRLRSRARSYGYLSTNNYQRVYLDSGYIRVVPVQARYIYVPSYDTQVVYTQRRSSSSSNIISFGLGLLIGSWLDRDVDWNHHRVYYHGWNGTGWISNSRSYVSVTNNYYVNGDYRRSPIQTDRNIRSRNIQNYRTNVRRNAGTFSLPGSRSPGRPGIVRNRNTPSVTSKPRVGDRRPTVNRRTPAVKHYAPATRTAPRVRSTRPTAKSSQSVWHQRSTPRKATSSIKASLKSGGARGSGKASSSDSKSKGKDREHSKDKTNRR